MYRKETRIPTILGLFLLFFSLGGVIYLDRFSHIFTSSAKTIPKTEDVHFTNITDNSFSVSWFTSVPSSGIAIVTNNSHSLTFLDDLDSDNVPRPRQTHHITVKNLNENTSYSVRITNNDPRCKNNDLCPIFSQKTASKIASVYTLPPARGSILREDNKPAEGTIVYLVLGQNLPLSGRVDSAGLWVIPLTNLRSQDMLTRIEPKDSDTVQITAKLANDLVATAITDVKSIRQNLTIPPMKIGNSYNFTNLESKKDLIAKLNEQNTLGIQTQVNQPPTATPVKDKQNNQIDILFPGNDGETTKDNQPRLRGIGLPKKILSITVNSTPQSAQITVDADGTWSWRPPKSLPPGTHYVTIKGYDSAGKLITVKRKFIVLKSGEQVLGEATAAATLTPTAGPSPTLEPTSTLAPSPSGITSTPQPTASVTTAPRSGTLEPTLILMVSGISLLLLGAKFLLVP